MVKRSAFVLLILVSACVKKNVNPDLSDSDTSVIEGKKSKANELVALSTVSITYTAKDQYGHIEKRHENHCTGTYVGANTILTAAHCIENKPQLCSGYVYWGLEVGAADPKKDFRKITQIVKHKGFNPFKPGHVGEKDYTDVPRKINDIAFVKFEGSPPVRSSLIPWEKVPQYRPAKVIDKRATVDIGNDVILAGFGSSSQYDSHGVWHSELYSAPLKITDFILAPKHFVTEHKTMGAGNGDSGGPLYRQVGNELEVVGITIRTGSGFGFGRDFERGVISIYEDAREYFDWYQKNAGVDLRTNQAKPIERTADAVVMPCD